MVFGAEKLYLKGKGNVDLYSAYETPLRRSGIALLSAVGTLE